MTQRLTDAQRDTAAANIKLIRKALSYCTRAAIRAVGGWDDALGVATDVYLRCVAVHDPAKGELSTLVFHAIRREIGRAAHRAVKAAQCDTRYAAEPPVAAEPPDEALIRRSVAAVRRLPPKLREVVEAVYLKGETQRTVALRLGVNRKTVQTRLASALAKLRRVLE